MPKKRKQEAARSPGAASSGLVAPPPAPGSKQTKPRDESTAEDGRQADELVFEDPYGDEYDSDSEAVEAATRRAARVCDDDADFEDEAAAAEDVEELEEQMRVWRPGIDTLGEEEVLDYDSSTYKMFHRLAVEWPCLSFDIFRDGLADDREKFPMTMYTVAGTQIDPESRATGAHDSLLVTKMSRLSKTQNDSDSEASSGSEDEDGDAVLEHRSIRHPGTVNRVRCQKQSPNVVATWSERASVQIYDVSKHLAILDGPLPLGQSQPSDTMPPLQSFAGACPNLPLSMDM